MTQTAASVETNRIDRRFSDLNGRPALILYITGGHPTLEASLEIAPIVAAGADVIEIGIPFSDPVADGPIIQASSQTALENGTSLEHCLEIARGVRATTETPIVLLTYSNPILAFGVDAFADACVEVGVDGVIAADMPAEESSLLHDVLTRRRLHLIPLVAPTSTDERIADACRTAGGFVYCISRTGVTGIRNALNTDLPEFLTRVRQQTNLPRAVGFGVSTPAQAREVAALAEGVIVGSALVDLMSHGQATSLGDRVQGFVEDFRRGVDGAQ